MKTKKIFDNSAFGPMFDETVVVRGRPVSACVFPAEKEDPLSEVAADSETLVATVLVKRVGANAWNDPAKPPKIGDPVVLDDVSYAVADVALFDANYFTLKCRQS